MGALWRDFDKDLLEAERKYNWRRDFALEFDHVVPVFYTNVLLVEDDPTTSQLIRTMIKRAVSGPVRIRSFASGERAGEYLHSLRVNNLPGPDLAIVDYRLTGETDGLWLCRLLARKFPDTQTVLTSTLTPDQIVQQLDRSQLRPVYMQKPLNPKYLQSLFDL